MDNSDDIFTFEVNDDDIVFDYNDYKDADNDISKPVVEKASEAEETELLNEGNKLTSEEKHNEFLRLRDSISRMNKGPVNDGFLKQAIEYKDTTIEDAEPVAFSCYWPTYEAMSFSQKSWYFYWRGQVRKGKYLKTDLSYIFTYIYELINEVGVENSADGFQKLCSVWGGYRDTYPCLDRYMSLWIEDYILINFKDGLSEDMLNGIENPDLIYFLPDTVLTDYILRTGAVELNGVKTFDYISRNLNIKSIYSKLCSGKHKNLMYENVPAVLMKINAYMKEKTGKGIIDTCKLQNGKLIKRMPYQNAVYQGKVRSVSLQILDLRRNKSFQIFISAIIRQTENVLREITGTKGRLRTYLQEEYSELIRQFLTEKIKHEQAEKRAKIEIDKDKINHLIKNSDEIREKLLSGIDEAYEPLQMIDTEPVNYLEAQSVESVSIVNAENESDNGIYSDLFGKLSAIQKNILSYIIDNGNEVSHSQLASEFQGVFTELEIDAINEYSIDCLGDILLLIEEDKIKLQEF